MIRCAKRGRNIAISFLSWPVGANKDLGSQASFSVTKRGLDRALDLDLEQTLEMEAHLQTLAALTPDHREAVKAFLEKRKPIFTG